MVSRVKKHHCILATLKSISLYRNNHFFIFPEISKKLANEWSQLGQDEKTKYHERAELDKERYNREFQEYQLTDNYKEFVAQQEAVKVNGETKPPKPKKPKKVKKKEIVTANEDSRDELSLCY